MPIQAKLLADFTEFDKACEKSRAELDSLSASAQKVGPATDFSMGQAASHATQLSNSLGNASTAANEFGTSVVSAADVAQQEFQKLPGVMAEVRGGLNEVAVGAGLTVAQIGLFGAAGAIVGTALGSWEIGRRVADFFELDEKIAHATATLFGWGDAVKEAAGAKADALERASRNAGRDITDLSEAMRINAQVVTDWNDAVGRANAPDETRRQIERWNQELDKLKNAGTLSGLTEDIKSQNFSLTYLAATYRTSVEAIQFYIREMKNAEDQSKKWRAEQAEQSKAASAAREKREKEEAATFAAVSKIERDANALSMGWVKDLGEAKARANMDQMRVTVKSINDTVALEREANTLRMSLYASDTEMKIQKVHDWYDSELAALNKSDENYERHAAALLDVESQRIAAIENTAAAAEAASRREVAAIDTVTKSYYGAIDAAAKLAGVTVVGHRAPYLDPTTGKWVDESQGAPEASLGGGSIAFQPGGTTDPRIISLMSVGYTLGEAQALVGGYGAMIGNPSNRRASGGSVEPGVPYIVGEQGPELYVPDRSGYIVPNGGGGASVVNHIYVNGTAEDVARRVAAEIMRTVTAGGKLSAPH